MSIAIPALKALHHDADKTVSFCFLLINFFPSIVCFCNVFIYCWLNRIFFTLEFVKQPAAIIVVASWSLRDFSVVLIKYCEFYPFVCFPWVSADVNCNVRQLCVFYVWFLVCFIYLQNTASFCLSLFSFYIKHLWLFWLFPLSKQKQNRVIRLFILRQSASLSAFYRYNQFFNPLNSSSFLRLVWDFFTSYYRFVPTNYSLWTVQLFVTKIYCNKLITKKKKSYNKITNPILQVQCHFA